MESRDNAAGKFLRTTETRHQPTIWEERKFCQHYYTNRELRIDWNLFSMLIESFLDCERGKKARDRDPE